MIFRKIISLIFFISFICLVIVTPFLKKDSNSLEIWKILFFPCALILIVRSPIHYVCRFLYPNRYSVYLHENAPEKMTSWDKAFINPSIQHIFFAGIFGLFILMILSFVFMFATHNPYFYILGFLQLVFTVGTFIYAIVFPNKFFGKYKSEKVDSPMQVIKQVVADLKTTWDKL